MENRFNIPDLTPMYNSVRDYIKEHQVEKGFINTSDEELDGVFGLFWSGCDDLLYERRCPAVRVKHDEIEVLRDLSCEYTMSDEEIVSSYSEDDWHPVMYSDIVYYIPTLFSLADNIEEYVEES